MRAQTSLTSGSGWHPPITTMNANQSHETFAATSAARRARRKDSIAILTTGAAFFMIVLDKSIVNLALPRIEDAFRADLATF